jgi:hypothetical protein
MRGEVRALRNSFGVFSSSAWHEPIPQADSHAMAASIDPIHLVSPSQEAGPSRSPRSNSFASAREAIPSPHHPGRSADNGDKEKPRTARACSSCNKQKLRCDGGRPCSRCSGLGFQTSCEYLPSLRGKTRKRKADRDKEQAENEILNGKRNRGENFDMWQKENALATTVARNSTLWADNRRPPSPLAASSPRMSVDKLTTLPLPGDVHNPLAVLAEASSTTNIYDPKSPVAGLKGKDGEDQGYYAPLERVLKDEAPHIMSRIDVHE